MRTATRNRGCSAGLSRFPPPSPTLTRTEGGDNRPITRPKVLIVTPHPVIGAGIETVLRLEDHYDVRRVGTLADAISLAESWPADAALVDGVLIENGWAELNVPCYVLSGDAESGQRLAALVPSARGWLLKDAPPARLVGAIDDAAGIVRVGTGLKGTIGMLLAIMIVLVFVAALGLFLWKFFLT